MTNESLASDLEHFFRSEEHFSIQFEQLPFAKNKNLALRWGNWLARVHYEEGATVVEDSAEISKIVDSTAPSNLASRNRRIRVVFGKDDKREYTNQMIRLMDFLRMIPGTVMSDPQQRDLIK